MKIAEIRGNREKREARLGAGRGPGPAPPGGPFEYETIGYQRFFAAVGNGFLPQMDFGGSRGGPKSGPILAPPGPPPGTQKSPNRKNRGND